METEFIQALKTGNKKSLRAVPKTDLHIHSMFGTKLTHLEEWIGTSVQPAATTLKTLDEMRLYAAEILYPHILSRRGFEFTAKSSIIDAIQDGVIVLEMSVDTKFIPMYSDKVQGFISYLASLKAHYSKEITFRPELGVSRDRDLKKTEEIANECIDSGFFYSIDLYGNESAHKPEVYKQLYVRAKNSGMKLKAHVGEFGSAESIRRTVEILEIDEVQHGINAVDSHEVMIWLAQNNIQLNVCPTSNVVLGRVPSLKEHPIRKLYDYGIPVTINTDDLMIFNQTVSDEYLNLYKAGLFSAEELNHIRKYSLREIY